MLLWETFSQVNKKFGKRRKCFIDEWFGVKFNWNEIQESGEHFEKAKNLNNGYEMMLWRVDHWYAAQKKLCLM